MRQFLYMRGPLYEGAGGGAGGAGGGAGGGGGDGGAGGGAGGGAPTPAPWGTDVNTMWNVGDKPWYETYVPEGPTRDLMRTKNYANPLVLADSYLQAQRLISDDKRVSLPTEGDDKSLNEFLTKWGRPADPKAYDLKVNDPAIQVEQPFLEWGKSLAFELGLNQKQAQKLVDKYVTYSAERMKDAGTAAAADNDKLLGDLTTALGDKKDTYLASGNRVLKALGSNKSLPDALKFTDADIAKVESLVGAGPVAKMLMAIGALSGEASFVTNDAGNGPPGSPEAMTPEQAATEINRLRADAQFQTAYTDKNHAEHAAALDKMNRLYARAGNKV